VTDLAANPCLLVCDWTATGVLRDGLPLFSCSGCGSEWVRTQAWTPARADGTVAPEVAAEAARQDRSAATDAPTNGHGAAEADSADT